MSRLFLALVLSLALGGLQLFAGAASSPDGGSIWDPNGQPAPNGGSIWDPDGQPAPNFGSLWDPNG
jgi:hypothetical protein